MAKVPFNVAAYTARLIGRENVATLNGAILELVKNTYDADAEICILYYDDLDNAFYIMDNGCGMTGKIIEKHWMTIGHSTKKKNYITDKGRIQTGAKGIGRFALDRIADMCTMITSNKENTIIWEVNWQDFEKVDNITDVNAEINDTDISFNEFISNIHNEDIKKIVRNYFNNSGTIFKLELLRDNWSDGKLNSIKNNLRSLIPAEIAKLFKIYLFNNKFNKQEAEVLVNTNDFDFDYKIEFDIEGSNVNISILRDEFDFINRFNEINNVLISNGKEPFSENDRRYFLGEPMQFYLAISQLSPGSTVDFSENFNGVFYFSKKSASEKDTKKYFYKHPKPKLINDIFTGIKLYRDKFRVRPYGEYDTSSYDWLLLANRKNSSPAAIAGKGDWKVNANQVFGSVYISRTNINLEDKSDREGIVETDEFRLLKEVLTNIISLFEEDRQYVFRKLRVYNEIIDEISRIEKEIEEKARLEEEQKNENDSRKNTTADNESDSTQTHQPEKISVTEVKKVLDQKNQEIKELEQEKNLLMILATTGIVTNTYVHEFKAQTQLLNTGIRTALNALQRENYNMCKEALEGAHSIRNSLNSWFEITVGAVSRDKRRQRIINISEYLTWYIQTWNEFFSHKEINISFLCEEDIMFKCFPYEIETILTNLITNSTSSFESQHISNKEIEVKVHAYKNDLVIEYSDNGKGLSVAYKSQPEKILKQFETDKRDELGEVIGTGMGMTIIKNIVDTYNGEIDLSRNSIIKSGFWVKLILKGVI